MLDVLIVGARCAGAPLSMLLAQKNYRVTVLDAASFPSDTISTHLIWPPGVAALHRWGLWPIIAAARPGICHTGLAATPCSVLVGPWHSTAGVDYTVNIRRFKLDAILVEAARRAGAEVREGAVVDSLLRDGDRVIGVTGHLRKSRTRFEERAAIVVGADGQRSTIARLVGAEFFDAFPSFSVTYYTYVSDLPADRDVDEVYTHPPREYLFSPTDDGLTVVNLVLSNELAVEFRGDVNGNFYRAFDARPELGERLRAARPVDRIRGALDQPNFYRRSHGPGWALVGDAAFTKDPVRAQGIADAFLDAEALARAVDAGLSGRIPLSAALADCERSRQERTAFPYELCLRAAQFKTPPGMDGFLELMACNPVAIAEMRGLISGSMRPEVFYDPQHLEQLFGHDFAALGVGP